ncbi:leucine-rich repeat protein kinase family protein [Tasmannia lanceolata]|uniref:leucine-rich repeat protein kinase family protein n=1 Tax=Tasmannia lanceolata TaxID=3420 RepID=UPI004064B61B
MQTRKYPNLLLTLLSLPLLVSAITLSSPPPLNSLIPSDALALLAFKASSDLDNKLNFSLKNSFHYCQWYGVKCAEGKVIRLVLEGLGLRGTFEEKTLTRLDQLRVLSLQSNSLSGPIPDFSKLLNLKTLFLDHNSFEGNFPNSIFSLHRIRTLDLSNNNLSGKIPTQLAALDRLYYLRLERNQFNGTIPPLNQSTLRIFNVSENNLFGAVPATPLFLGFDTSAFSGNPALCGEVIHKQCQSHSAFFASSLIPPPPRGGEEMEGILLPPPSPKKKPKRTAVVIGFSVGVLLVIGFLLGVSLSIKKMQNHKPLQLQTSDSLDRIHQTEPTGTDNDNALFLDGPLSIPAETKAGKMQVGKSGSLVFCAGEPQIYTVEQLMRASAEMLGRGTMGTSYKAVLDNQLIVGVKRLDAGKISPAMTRDGFQMHLETVGNLRHPNLVPLRAYFQAKEERLLVYDYQPNGSLFSLIHGTRSTRAKPLHWTSCLKIAEDVAQGLAHIHQSPARLVHGNIKSSNVLLGPDFEACLTDYCLTPLLNDSSESYDSDSSGYAAPETRKSTRERLTTKSDVFSFGMLLLEILTGRSPLQLPSVQVTDLASWALSSARDEQGNEQNRLAMLLDIATGCIRSSPEQRPTTWQVLKMIQEVKESQVEDNAEIS